MNVEKNPTFKRVAGNGSCTDFHAVLQFTTFLTQVTTHLLAGLWFIEVARPVAGSSSARAQVPACAGADLERLRSIQSQANRVLFVVAATVVAEMRVGARDTVHCYLRVVYPDACVCNFSRSNMRLRRLPAGLLIPQMNRSIVMTSECRCIGTHLRIEVLCCLSLAKHFLDLCCEMHPLRPTSVPGAAVGAVVTKVTTTLILLILTGCVE